MRVLLCTLVVSAALLALLNESTAQEIGSEVAAPDEAAAQLATPEAQRGDFEDRANAVRAEDISAALGALAHAERAKERHQELESQGHAQAATRAERIALRALELAEMIVRREHARARILALRRERAQIAHRMERARSVLEHQLSLPAEFPPDPNIETDEPSDTP